MGPERLRLGEAQFRHQLIHEFVVDTNSRLVRVLCNGGKQFQWILARGEELDDASCRTGGKGIVAHSLQRFHYPCVEV